MTKTKFKKATLKSSHSPLLPRGHVPPPRPAPHQLHPDGSQRWDAPSHGALVTLFVSRLSYLIQRLLITAPFPAVLAWVIPKAEPKSKRTNHVAATRTARGTRPEEETEKDTETSWRESRARWDTALCRRNSDPSQLSQFIIQPIEGGSSEAALFSNTKCVHPPLSPRAGL